MNDITIFTKSGELTTLNEEQLEKIKTRLPEFYRASAIIGHSTSQSSYSLQTMNMMDDSPLSRMKQCLSQINKKYLALQEAYFKIERKKISIERLQKNVTPSSSLTIRQHTEQIKSISIFMENALRQIGMFQDMYDSIRKNNKIPENWTEKDFEKQEIQNMIKKSFRLGIQDVQATGNVSKSAVEYWEQLGIHPQVASILIQGYVISIRDKIEQKEDVTITHMHEFLDQMADKFKDSHKLALKRIGLDELGSEGFMANGATKPQ